MIKLLSIEVENIINASWVQATENKQEYLLIENILLAMLEDNSIKTILSELEVNVDELKQILEKYLEKEIEHGYHQPPKQTLMFKKILQYLIFHSQQNGNISHPKDLFLAIFNETETMAVITLEDLGLDEQILKEYLQTHDFDERDEQDISKPLKPSKKKQKTTLEQYAINLTLLAKENMLEPVIGRDEEVVRLTQILSRKNKNNPLLVGESGVGKTSCVDKLAQDIVSGNVPKQLQDWEIFSIDVTAMIAGAKFRGDFEKRMKDLLFELEEKENCIAFIDEFHTLFGLGASNSNQLDATNILKPALMNGKIKIMGATTYDEAKKTLDKNKPMSRRFQKVDVCEPDEETTLEIIKGLKPNFESFHNVKYSESILNQIVYLTGKYINDEHFPDKAIDVVDELGAMLKIKNIKKKQITEKMVNDLISKKAKVPVIVKDGNDKIGLSNLESNVKKELFGQDHAIEEVIEKIILARAGLNEENKPLFAYLLAGDSGVGKTELAKQIADNLNMRLIRFDMSELHDEVSINKLIGTSSGYVGYEEGGQLVNEIKKYPHSILLLDEIEKAHPKVLNTFLQVLEESELSSGDNTTAYFNNVGIFFTTNVGSNVTKSVGFGNKSVAKNKSNIAIEKRFTPEFRNRLDGIITFNSLEEKQILQITDKLISDFKKQLLNKNIKFVITKQAKKYLSDEGFDDKLGARPMKRVIQNKIKKPIAKELVLGVLKNGGSVSVSIVKNEIKLEFEGMNDA